MSLKTCIEKLFSINSNYFHPDQAFNQASSLETLSNDLYTDPLRFIYELIQNADDALSSHVRMEIINDDYLIVSHNGRIFNENDVRSICSINNSTKTRVKQTAGYIGLGFKALFGKSRYVLIITDDSLFRFDAEYNFEWPWKEIDRKTWEDENARNFTFPWQICPIWTSIEALPKPVKSCYSKNKDKMKVKIIIGLLNINEAKRALEDLANSPETFLFLRHVHQIDLFGINKPTSIYLTTSSDESITLEYNKKLHSSWLLHRKDIKIPRIVRDDKRLPIKLCNTSTIEMILAAKLDNTNPSKFIPISDSNNPLFAYIPTKIFAYNLPLLVNTQFLTNANREQIHSLDLLPVKIKSHDILTEKYNDSCSQALIKNKLISNNYREKLSLREAVIDLTGLSEQDFMGNDPIRSYILKKYHPDIINLPLHPFIRDNSRLKELVIQIFNWEDLISMFNSNDFQKTFTIDQNIKLISYLYDKREDIDISKILHRLPFIFDRNKRLKIPNHIYLPSKFTDRIWNNSDCEESFIDNELLSKLNKIHQQSLEKLGVIIKTDLSYLERTIIPNVSTFITLVNAIPTIQQLFYLYTNNQINETHFCQLKELKLLTKANTLVPANRLYFSAE